MEIDRTEISKGKTTTIKKNKKKKGGKREREREREEKMTILLKAVWTQSTCDCIDEVR